MKRVDELYPYQEKVIAELKAAYLAQSVRHRAYLHMATGSGKTLTLAEFIGRNYLSLGKRVLWITHRWPLLNQALRTFLVQYPRIKCEDDIAYYASASNPNARYFRDRNIFSLKDCEFGDLPKLLFTTWQSLDSLPDGRTKAFKKLTDFHPDLIVVDEAHHGKSGGREVRFYENLVDEYWPDVSIVGLTGTPKVRTKHGWSKKKLGNIYFSWLVEQGYLARPENVALTVPASVKIRFDKNNMIDNEVDLAGDMVRNRAIVDEFLRQQQKFGKTLLFAINIPHANTLASLLRDRGVSVVAIHSDAGPHPAALIDDFYDGKYRVAVVVDMMNEGVDVPDIRSLFLARPVTSEIEFAQMVGRGCRRASGKDFFNVVDFYNAGEDEENRRHIKHFKDWYNSEREEPVASMPSSVSPPRTAIREHESCFVPAMETLIYKPAEHPDFFSSLSGLRIDSQQTFGVEFELESEIFDVDQGGKAAWLNIATPLLHLLRNVFGDEAVGESARYEHEAAKSIDHEHWHVVRDGSCGFEVVTPILRGRRGFEDIVRFLRALRVSGLLQKYRLKVSPSTGTHVHLGWRYRDPEKVRDILRFMRKYEGAFHSLLAPSRVFQRSGEESAYAAPIRTRFSASSIAEMQTVRDVTRIFRDDEERYHALNLTNFESPNSTLEIRSHQGTLSEYKICLWISLWMNVHNALERIQIDDLGSSDPGKNYLLPSSDPRSDVILLANEVLRAESENFRFLRRLHERRREVISNKWWRRELGDSSVDALITTWDERLTELGIPDDSVVPVGSGLENVFRFSEIPEVVKLGIVKSLIESNKLSWTSPEGFSRHLSRTNLFVHFDGERFLASTGIKLVNPRFIEAIREALMRSENLIFPSFKHEIFVARLEEGNGYEKGWDFNRGDKAVFRAMNRFVGALAKAMRPDCEIYAFVREQNDAARGFYAKAKFIPVLRLKSPYSDERLVMFVDPRSAAL